jgi:hypothetical protein
MKKSSEAAWKWPGNVRFDTDWFRCHLTLGLSVCQRGKAANSQKSRELP